MERPPRDENNIEDNPERCDQSRSRIARRALDEFFFPLFVNEREEVPERCPFKRSRDAYREIESMKMRKNFNSRRKEDEWKDVSSGKVFKSEAEIDAYLTGRFLNEKKNAGGDVCLADYCDVLRCDEYSESLETSSASPTKREKKDSAAAKTRAGAHCYALTKICFPERSESAVQAKNSRRWFESVFCDANVGLHQDGRNAFSHIRKQEFRYPVSGQRQQHQHRGRVGNANTYDNASATSSSSSSSSSFLIISTLFVFLGFIFYLLFVLAPSMNRRASSDLNARKGRRSASKKKSMKDVAFEFCNRALVLSGFKPKKKRY